MRRIALSFALALLGLTMVAITPASARHCYRHYSYYRTYPYRYASYPRWWSNPYRYTAWNRWNYPNGGYWGGGLFGGLGAAVAAPFEVAGAATGAALAAPYNVAYNAPLMTGRSVAVRRICTGRSVYYRHHHRYYRHACRY